MNDAWATAVRARLAAARLSPPGAETLSSAVQSAATAGARSVALRGRPASVSVSRSRDRITIAVSGPGAREARSSIRAELARRLPAAVTELRRQATQSLRSR